MLNLRLHEYIRNVRLSFFIELQVLCASFQGFLKDIHCDFLHYRGIGKCICRVNISYAYTLLKAYFTVSEAGAGKITLNRFQLYLIKKSRNLTSVKSNLKFIFRLYLFVKLSDCLIQPLFSAFFQRHYLFLNGLICFGTRLQKF